MQVYSYGPLWFVALLYVLQILFKVAIPDVLFGIAWLLVLLVPAFGLVVIRTRPPG